MSAACLTSCLVVSALLLNGNDPRGARTPAKGEDLRGQGKMVRVVYPLSDLIVPAKRGDVEGQGEQAKLLREAIILGMSELGPTPRSPIGRPEGTIPELLMKLITQTRSPEAWSCYGGQGIIQYDAIGQRLIVIQTQDVQEEIAALLAAIRRRNEQEVVVEVRILSVSESVCERLAKDFKLNLDPAADGVTLLDSRQALRLMTGGQDDRRVHVMAAPRMTLLSGQKASLDLTQKHSFVTGLKVVREEDEVVVRPKSEEVNTGFRCSVLPVIAADWRSVKLHVTAENTDLGCGEVPRVPVSVKVPAPGGKEETVSVQMYVQKPSPRTMKADRSFHAGDGQTAVFLWGKSVQEVRTEHDGCPEVLKGIPYVNRLFRNVGYGQETRCALLLVTPRIVRVEEEEAAEPGKAGAAPRP